MDFHSLWFPSLQKSSTLFPDEKSEESHNILFRSSFLDNRVQALFISTPSKRHVTELQVIKRPVNGVSPIVFAEDSECSFGKILSQSVTLLKTHGSPSSDLGIMSFSLNNCKEASLPVKPLLKTQNASLERIFCNTSIKLFLFWQDKPLHSSSLLKTLEVFLAWVFTFVILSEIFAAVLKISHSPSFYTLASLEFFHRLQDNTPS